MVTLVGPLDALKAILLADADVQAAVGNERIYPFVLPRLQGEGGHAIVYFEVSSQGDQTTQGPSGLVSTRVQVNCFAGSPDEAYGLGLKVKAVLDGYRGTVSGVEIGGVFFDSARDLYDDTVKLRFRSMDFIVWYGER